MLLFLINVNCFLKRNLAFQSTILGLILRYLDSKMVNPSLMEISELQTEKFFFSTWQMIREVESFMHCHIFQVHEHNFPSLYFLMCTLFFVVHIFMWESATNQKWKYFSFIQEGQVLFGPELAPADKTNLQITSWKAFVLTEQLPFSILW